MNLNRAINRYILGKILGKDLPGVALQALEDGHDSRSLCQLASANGLGSDDLRMLFFKALEELGLSIPSPTEAGLAEARFIAEDILNGSITPYAGAKRIWGEVYTHFPKLKQLKPFVGLASEYEDDEKHRDEYARMIVEECKGLFSE